mgnify:CR=1 FL=1
MVGDTDQNIYSWRGANLKNIMNFEHDFPNTKIVLLEENYRSTKNILALANNTIKKNVVRKEKNLFTGNEEGDKIEIYPAWDEQSEAEKIAFQRDEKDFKCCQLVMFLFQQIRLLLIFIHLVLQTIYTLLKMDQDTLTQLVYVG